MKKKHKSIIGILAIIIIHYYQVSLSEQINNNYCYYYDCMYE